MTEDELLKQIEHAMWQTFKGRPHGDDMPKMARAALAKLRELDCVWTEEPDAEYWATACGKAFSIIDETPSENGMRFCPYCGLQLVERTQPEESPC